MAAVEEDVVVQRETQARMAAPHYMVAAAAAAAADEVVLPVGMVVGLRDMPPRVVVLVATPIQIMQAQAQPRPTEGLVVEGRQPITRGADSSAVLVGPVAAAVGLVQGEIPLLPLERLAAQGKSVYFPGR